MTAPHHEPAKRLLVAPAVLLVVVLAAVIAVPRSLERPPEPETVVEDLPRILSVDAQCRRGAEPDIDREVLIAGRGRVTSDQVLACPALFDQLIVTFVGELVGDLLHRDGGAWILVNDDDYALRHGPLPAHRVYSGTNTGLSVWIPDEFLGEVRGLGRPDQRGDVVELQGRIERTDPADGGGLTLRAQSVEVLRPAERFARGVDAAQAVLAAVSLVAGAAFWFLRRRTPS